MNRFVHGFKSLAMSQSLEQLPGQSATVQELAEQFQSYVTAFAMDKIYACHPNVSSVIQLLSSNYCTWPLKSNMQYMFSVLYLLIPLLILCLCSETLLRNGVVLVRSNFPIFHIVCYNVTDR
jgi:hypothetical protein